jgi:hypothetical protein
MPEKFLFVCGCPRSGTSAFARLLGAHDRIVMGMERFGHRVSPGNFTLTPNLFSKEKFFNIQPGDTFYVDFEAYHKWDPFIKEKFDNAIYVGDKRPDLFYVYDRVFDAFPNATIMFIYRDVFDVAASYNKRAGEGNNWPSHKDYKKAVVEWGLSLRHTLECIRNKMRLYCVKYEDLFSSHCDIDVIFDVLDLPFDERSRHAIVNLRKISEKLSVQRRNIGLSENDSRYVSKHAEFRYYEQIERLNLLRS